ncbi:hypothetical protein J132_08096 [Termitomyces sp. J132]|nr:hypothetical protein J132_08096 [Termitomyces sp. J132]
MLAISSPTRARLISFINFGWNATHWNVDNLESFVSSWAQRESAVSPVVAETIVDIVRNLTRYNSRRKPELIDTTTYSSNKYREADNVLADWAMLKNASTEIDNSLSSDSKAAFSQLIQHPIVASANLANLLITIVANEGEKQVLLRRPSRECAAAVTQM